MTESLGRAELELATNQGPLEAGLKQGEQKTLGFLGRVKQSFGRLSGTTMGGAILQGVGLGAGLGAFNMIQAGIGKTIEYFGDAIQAASDLAETTSKVAVVFGTQSDKVMELGETSATAMGMSKNAALAAAGTYGNLFRAMGITEDASASMSTGLVQLAADLASFNNMEPEVVLDKLRAGLSGETEPLKTLGINLNIARIQAKALKMGLWDGVGAISASAKAQATYALILDDTSLAQGDFARTSDGLANQQRILDASMADLSAEIGEKLLPILVELMHFANDVLVPGLKATVDAVTAIGEAVDAVKGPVDDGFAAWGAAADLVAMRFGDMGDRVAEIAEQTGDSVEIAGVRIWNRMQETGESFDEAAAHIESSYAAAARAATTSTEDMVDEVKGQQRDLLEATRETTDGIEDEYASTYRHTLQDTRQWAADMLAIYKEQEDPVRQAGQLAADAFTDPIITGNKIAATEAELGSKELREALSSQDAEIKRDAEERRATLVAELIKLKNEQATQGDAMAQLARTQALLTGQFMADGLNSKDAEVRAAFVGWKTELELRLGQLQGAAYTGGTRVTAEFARGIRLTQWTMATALQNAVQLARNQFPGSEPRDPNSPLRGITKAFGFMDVLAGGITSSEGALAGALQGAARRARQALTIDGFAAPSFALADPGARFAASGGVLERTQAKEVHYHLTVNGVQKTVHSDEEALAELKALSAFGDGRIG